MESKSQGTKVQTSKDRGWAWIVCVATAVYNMMVSGTIKSLGIVYLEFIEIFDDDQSQVAWIGITYALCRALLGPLVGRIQDACSQNGLRLIIFFGTLTVVAGFIAASWSKSVVQVILTFGLLSGVATAIIDPAVLSFIGIYFDERMILACSISFTGRSLGGFVIPPLLTWANRIYGGRGALMILGGAWMHVLLIAAICRPLKQPLSSDAKRSIHGNSSTVSIDVTGDRDSQVTKISKTISHDSGIDIECQTSGESNPVDSFCSYDVPPDDNQSDSSPQNSANTKNTSSHASSGHSKSYLKSFGSYAKDYWKFLKSPGLVLLLITFAIAGFSHLTTFFILPPLLNETGLGKDLATDIIMVASASEVIARPIIGVITDRIGRKRIFLLHASFLISAALGFYAAFSLSKLSFYIQGVNLGIMGGVYIPFILPLLKESASDEYVSRVAGLFPFLVGIGPAVGQYCVNALEEHTGTYRDGLIMLASTYFCAFLLIVAWCLRCSIKPKRTRTLRITEIKPNV